MTPKGATLVFLPFPVFWGLWEPQLDPIIYFWGPDRLRSEGSQNSVYACAQPLLRISLKKVGNYWHVRPTYWLVTYLLGFTTNIYIFNYYYITSYKLQDSLTLYMKSTDVNICAGKPNLLPVMVPNAAGYCIYKLQKKTNLAG